MQRMSRRQIRLLRETVAFSSDAAAGIAGLPEHRLRRPRRRHRPARREDVPAEGATPKPVPTASRPPSGMRFDVTVENECGQPHFSYTPYGYGVFHESRNEPQAPAMRHRGPATLSAGPLPALCLHR